MPLTRRQFLYSSAALAAVSAASWQLWRGLNALPPIHVNRVGLPLGHALRDNALPPQAKSEHRCDILILGGGAAGLSALWYLAKHGRRDILLAEGFERNGNNAAYRHQNLAAPSGAHYLALPSEESVYVREMLHDLGIMADGRFNETDLVYAPQERLLYQGSWRDHLAPQDADGKRFFALTGRLKTAYGRDGRKIFAIPIDLSSQDEEWRQLDTLTFARWLQHQNYRSAELLWYLDYCCRDDYGAGIAEVSAFAGLHYFCARGDHADTVLTWPEGLAHLSEALRRRSGLQTLPRLPEQPQWRFDPPASCDVSAVKIEELPNGANVWLRHNVSGETVSVLANRVICAMPLMVAARITSRPEYYGLHTPDYAPWLVGNFVINRFPAEIGRSETAWDNVVYGSPNLGYVSAANQFIRTAKPERAVFTSYTAFGGGKADESRRMLLHAPSEELLPYAAHDLLQAYGSRFFRHVEQIDLTVRGHGMSIPYPGYLNRPQLLQLRRHNSPLLFAHSDLSGYSVFEEAVYWGVEAAKKTLDAV